MKNCPCPTGRPTPAALALGFAGATMACLLARDLLLAFGGNTPAAGLALAVFPLGLALGLRLAPRFFTARTEPADLLAPMLGLLALCLPFSLFVLRTAVRPPAVAGITVSGVALVGLATLAAMLPLCLCLGAGLAFTARVGERQPTPPRLPLAASLALGAALGAAFVQWIAIPKLSPVNASLDAGIGCCLAGVLCAAGAPDGRRMETWLPLLAFVFVLVLPLSSIIDARFAALEWGRAAADIPTAPPLAALAARGPAAVLTACLPLLAAGLGAILFLCKPGAQLAGRETRIPAAMGLADAAALFTLLLAFAAVGGDLFGRLSGLVAAYAAGQALALSRKGAPCPFAPSPALFFGCALGLALPSLLLLL